MVMRVASADGQIDPASLVRPVFWGGNFTALFDKTLILIEGRHGLVTADRYARTELDARRLIDLAHDLASGWQSLSILSPETGRVGPGDRQEARIVASRMRSMLRTLDRVSQNLGSHARELRIKPKLEPGRRTPSTCADLWRWNSNLYDPKIVPATREKHIVGPSRFQPDPQPLHGRRRAASGPPPKVRSGWKADLVRPSLSRLEVTRAVELILVRAACLP